MLTVNQLFQYVTIMAMVQSVPNSILCDGFKIVSPETRQHEAVITRLAPKSFYFIRHGQNGTGREQAKVLQDKVGLLDISCVYYSPLSRAHETMEIVCKHIPAITKVSAPSLMERHFGEWQGELCDQEALTKYRNTVPVNGESEDEYFDRVVNCANDILAVAEGQVLIVAHGGVFWSLCKAAGVDYAVINNCSILHFVAPHESCDQWMIYEL
jgi:broad specificity phosphatase PhoE